MVQRLREVVDDFLAVFVTRNQSRDRASTVLLALGDKSIEYRLLAGGGESDCLVEPDEIAPHDPQVVHLFRRVRDGGTVLANVREGGVLRLPSCVDASANPE